MRKQLTEAIEKVKESIKRADKLFKGIGVSAAYFPSQSGDVMVYSGFKKLADFYGCQINKGESDVKEYPKLFWFSVDGITYYTISNDKTLKYTMDGELNG